MKTTVIIPNYNGIKFIEECLESLRSINVEDFAVIIVDNASTDGSMELIRDKYPEMLLLPQDTNTGFAAAVNIGIRAATTEYVLLLNNDTVVRPGFVRNLEKRLDKEADVFSVSSRMLSYASPEIIDGCGDYYCALGWAYAFGKDSKVDKKCTEPGYVFSACAGAAIYRRQALIDIGLFDEAHFAYLEDVDVGYRAKIYGYRNAYEPSAEVLHMGSGSSGSRHNEFKVNLSSRNSVYLIWKNMPFLQWLLNLPFFIIGFGIKILFFTLKGLGFTYIRGLLRGVALSFSSEGRKNKVRFKWKNLGNYCRIQLELWVNIIRRFSA